MYTAYLINTLREIGIKERKVIDVIDAWCDNEKLEKKIDVLDGYCKLIDIQISLLFSLYLYVLGWDTTYLFVLYDVLGCDWCLCL